MFPSLFNCIVRMFAPRVTFPLLLLGLGLVPTPQCHGRSVGFEETGSLGQARAYHTATLLPDGKVLVTGGSDGSQINRANDLASSEVYDPATRTWTATGSLANRRHEHTATLLPNGKVLVVGGTVDFINDLTSAELYDPATGTWTPTGSLNNGRRAHTATLLPNGKVLAAAGIGDGTILKSAEVYDPAAAIWIPTSDLSTWRAYHTATLLPNNKVLVTGGYSGGYSSPYLSHVSAELYDPTTGSWIPTGSLITRREQHTATLLANGTVLIAAG